MKVAVIGGGGREHALAWRLSQSKRLTKLYCLPGNPGTLTLAENVDIAANDVAKIEKFCRQNAVELVVVGPEEPLALGLTDVLEKAGIKVFGPSRDAARLEADKWFAKELMRHQAVPTAEARSFTSARAATEYVGTRELPLVVKATGLAAGKGVTIAYRAQDAIDAIDAYMTKKVFGDAGSRVVIEEMLKGPECSVLAFVEGNHIYLMDPCQDHKPIDDGNTGAMTGGMGAFCPTPTVSDTLLAQIERDVFIPVLDGLRREGVTYRGVLYAGLMLTAAGPKVLEFNVRFGDPETQPLMMRLKSDLLEVMLAVAEGRLDEANLDWDPRPALCVVATSRGYPGKYKSDDVITGIPDADSLEDVKVFQAGTRRFGADTLTAGGRVLAVTAIGDTMDQARQKAYAGMSKIHFDGMHVRSDIGTLRQR